MDKPTSENTHSAQPTKAAKKQSRGPKKSKPSVSKNAKATKRAPKKRAAKPEAAEAASPVAAAPAVEVAELAEGSAEIDANLEAELTAPPEDTEHAALSKKQLEADAKDRAKKRPVVEKIAQALKGEKSGKYRELIINSEPLECRVALLVDGVLEKFEIERPDEQRNVGAIFKGKVQNLELGLKAAFVDIGREKNAFLHYWDMVPGANNDNSIEVVRENRSAAQKKTAEKVRQKDIPKLYPAGSDIVVQIVKDQIGTKGPRTTTNVALPGRFLVLMPNSGQCGISRKITDRGERERLKQILKSLTIPEGMGVVMRTAGEGKKARFFVRDFHLLLKTWQSIEGRIENEKGPLHLYQEPGIIERTVRDFLTEDIDRVLIDNPEDHARMQAAIGDISPRSKRKIALYEDDIPVFERYNIERQIEQTFDRSVPLPSGGSLVIEETEALIAIDVNTGGHKGGKKDGKDFIVRCNEEAALEAARQIRLRNVGGLVILDFIDMKHKNDRKRIYDIMRKELAKDKAKSHVLPISQLGILQLTRQRHSESNSSGLYIPCPYSNGRGKVKSPRTMSIEINRKLSSALKHTRSKGGTTEGMHIILYLHPDNFERIKGHDTQHLLQIEKDFGVRLSFRTEYSYHIEKFLLINEATGQPLA